MNAPGERRRLWRAAARAIRARRAVRTRRTLRPSGSEVSQPTPGTSQAGPGQGANSASAPAPAARPQQSKASQLARLRATLEVVAHIEAVESSLRSTSEPVTLWVRGSVARRPEVKRRVLKLIPQGQLTGWDQDADREQIQARVSADVVVLGKFDVGEQPKFRAAYAKGRRSLAARPRTTTGVCGITNTVEALQVVARHAPDLAPPLLGHGRLEDGLPYVVEGWVRGRALRSSTELREALPQILDGLNRLHRGYGVTPVRLTERWQNGFAERWESTVGTGVVPEELASWISELIARDGMLRHSWTHGDLVASNVLRSKKGIVLVDWEHSAEAPIMNDAAKLHLFAAAPTSTMRDVLAAFDPMDDPDAYQPGEELALCHAQLISHYPRRRAALRGHRRAEIYERQVRRQLDRVAEVQNHLAG